MTIDWEKDLEMKKLRDEFIDSLADRRALLIPIQLALATSDAPEVRLNLRTIAHNLAGTAGSYGFPVLYQIGAKLDDLLSLDAKIPPEKMRRFAGLLEQAIDQTFQTRQDPGNLLQDSRFAELTFLVGALASSASS
jgi:HPt (histidine-containing phosphotransfer) domain-containing protein